MDAPNSVPVETYADFSLRCRTTTTTQKGRVVFKNRVGAIIAAKTTTTTTKAAKPTQIKVRRSPPCDAWKASPC